jgi:Zn-dependent peptidase ImmA (M78 family)
LEAEAQWLGPALLVSEEAALYIAETEMSMAHASSTYGVSEAIIMMRLGVTGASRRIERRRAARR